MKPPASPSRHIRLAARGAQKSDRGLLGERAASCSPDFFEQGGRSSGVALLRRPLLAEIFPPSMKAALQIGSAV